MNFLNTEEKYVGERQAASAISPRVSREERFSHQNAEQIIYWNLIDGYVHVSSASQEEIEKTQGDMTLGENVFYVGLLRFDASPKPAYNPMKRLINEEWHTECKITTDENGAASFRGFYGEYEILNTDREFTLSSKNENTVEIIL